MTVMTARSMPFSSTQHVEEDNLFEISEYEFRV